MPLWLELVLWIGGSLVAIFLVALTVVTFLLIREDLRTAMADNTHQENRRKAKAEERRQAVLHGERVWRQTVFHHGVDRVSGTKITRSSTQNTPEADRLWDQMEKQLHPQAKDYRDA